MKILFAFICCSAISSTGFAQEAVRGEPETPRSSTSQKDSTSAVKCLKSGPGWSLSGMAQQEKFLGDNEISDEEMIARLAYAEAVGLGGPGVAPANLTQDANAIAETILNRSLIYAKRGKSLSEMIYKKNEYSAIQAKNNKPSPDFLCPKNAKLWSAVREHVHGLYEDGSIRLLSGEATAYYKDSGKGPIPKWAKAANEELPKGATANHLRFYKDIP